MTQGILQGNLNDAEKLIRDLQRLGNLQLSGDQRSKIFAIVTQDVTRRYIQISRETRFAPASLGRRRRSGGITRQSPATPFGIDTRALFEQITRDIRFTDGGITVGSDLAYSVFQQALFVRKSPKADGYIGILGLSPDSQDKLLNVYGDGIAKIWSD